MSDISSHKPVNIGTARVLEEQLLYSGCWSEMVEFSYEDDDQQIRKWEGLHRKHRAEAVIIVARMKPSGKFIFIRQFRPPTDSYILEFPAGLVERGESLEKTATRELFEETGYIGTVQDLSPKLFSSPGILSETVSFVNVQVDENKMENQQPKAKNELGEFIKVFVKSAEEIPEFFNQEVNYGVKFDVKLYTYFMVKGLL